jgi:pyruvate ferredoxin oxidoreductase delta subunit
MYYVAKVNEDMCSTHNCTMCTLYCPEANTLMADAAKNTSYVVEDRCKGCAICVYVCSDLLKRDCITMVMAGEED